MKLASLPAPQIPKPAPHVPGQPQLVPAKPKRRWLFGVVAILVAATIGVAYHLLQRVQAPATPSPGIPTAPVIRGDLIDVIRLTGKTSAENSVTLRAPTLQGRRGRVSGVNRQNMQTTVLTQLASLAGTSAIGPVGMSSSGSSAAASESGGSSNSGSQGRSSFVSSNVSSSLSRFGSVTAQVRSQQVRSPVQTAMVGGSIGSTMGQTGLGSTEASLPGGSSGPPRRGGRSREFQLIIQEIVPAGTRVKKGDVVVRFDQVSWETRLQDMETTLSQSEATFQKLVADYNLQKQVYQNIVDRARAALEKARLDYQTAVVRSAIEKELLQLRVKEAEAVYNLVTSSRDKAMEYLDAQLREAEYQLKEARAEYEIARRLLDRMTLHAPMDGIVILHQVRVGGQFRNVRVGDVIGYGEPILRIVDTSEMIVEAVINQADVEKIRLGQKAIVRFDAYPDLELPAHVFSIGAIAQAGAWSTGGVRNVPVKLKLEKTHPLVLPDLSVAVDLILSEQPDQLLVPRHAVHRDEQTGESYVYVKQGEKWEKRPVKLGRHNYIYAAVLDGLREGEVVALAPVDNTGAGEPGKSSPGKTAGLREGGIQAVGMLLAG